MKKRIFISALSFRAPTLHNLEELQSLMSKGRLEVEPEAHSLTETLRALIYNLNLKTESPLFPNRKDVKVMRDDVIAATKCGQEILQLAGIDAEARRELTLYMSNGVCLDQLLDNINDISRAYASKEYDDQDLGQKHKRVEKATPPLFVLNALTNGAGSFVAQYTGVKGDNVVYGNTSHATYDCIEEGIHAIESGKKEMVLIGAANGAGLFSALTFKNLADLGNKDWKSSNAASFILLENHASIIQRGVKPFAEVTQIMKSKSIPSLFQVNPNPYSEITPKSSIACFSGGLGEGDYETEKKTILKKWKEGFSLYPYFGSLGVAAPLMNLYASILRLNQGEESIDCLNRDPYGRESLIQLGQVKNL